MKARPRPTASPPAPPAATRVAPPSAPRLAQLLFVSARLLDETAQAQVNREAGERVARPALMRLLPFLDFDGVRPTELARRIDVSKQAVGQSLAELEGRGLVEYVPDPHDGRALKVRLTELGAAAFEHGNGVLSFYEAELEARVGKRKMDMAAEALTSILEVLQDWQATGAPTRAPPPPSLPPKTATKRRRT